MSGVIDAHGIQWEHCTLCGGWERVEYLFYGKPSVFSDTSGADVCQKCVVKLSGKHPINYDMQTIG